MNIVEIFQECTIDLTVFPLDHVKKIISEINDQFCENKNLYRIFETEIIVAKRKYVLDKFSLIFNTASILLTEKITIRIPRHRLFYIQLKGKIYKIAFYHRDIENEKEIGNYLTETFYYEEDFKQINCVDDEKTIVCIDIIEKIPEYSFYYKDKRWYFSGKKMLLSEKHISNIIERKKHIEYQNILQSFIIPNIKNYNDVKHEKIIKNLIVVKKGVVYSAYFETNLFHDIIIINIEIKKPYPKDIKIAIPIPQNTYKKKICILNTDLKITKTIHYPECLYHETEDNEIRLQIGILSNEYLKFEYIELKEK